MSEVPQSIYKPFSETCSILSLIPNSNYIIQAINANKFKAMKWHEAEWWEPVEDPAPWLPGLLWLLAAGMFAQNHFLVAFRPSPCCVYCKKKPQLVPDTINSLTWPGQVTGRKGCAALWVGIECKLQAAVQHLRCLLTQTVVHTSLMFLVWACA